MNKYIVNLSENNSGGSFYLSGKDYDRLEEAGWEVDRGPDSYRHKYSDGHPDGASRVVYAKNEDQAYEEAVGEFEAVTGAYRDLVICNCCGSNFWFSVDEEDYTWEDQFEDAVREALKYSYGATELTDIVERIAYS
jgi:hypothetical protein